MAKKEIREEVIEETTQTEGKEIPEEELKKDVVVLNVQG